MKMVQRWKEIIKCVRVELFLIRFRHVPNDRAVVLDDMPVAVDDGVALKPHGSSFLKILLQKLPTREGLSRSYYFAAGSKEKSSNFCASTSAGMGRSCRSTSR